MKLGNSGWEGGSSAVLPSTREDGRRRPSPRGRQSGPELQTEGDPRPPHGHGHRPELPSVSWRRSRSSRDGCGPKARASTATPPGSGVLEGTNPALYPVLRPPGAIAVQGHSWPLFGSAQLSSAAGKCRSRTCCAGAPAGDAVTPLWKRAGRLRAAQQERRAEGGRTPKGLRACPRPPRNLPVWISPCRRTWPFYLPRPSRMPVGSGERPVQCAAPPSAPGVGVPTPPPRQ